MRGDPGPAVPLRVALRRLRTGQSAEGVVTSARGPQGVDLGRLNPDCTAPRHGTYSAYHVGCRCPHAREDHRLYQKRHREGRAEPKTVDGCGTRRRIQAMWAIGHTSQTISDETGGVISAVHVGLITNRRFVTPATHNVIAAAYRVLAGRPGTSVRTRARAVKAGYPSPMRWGSDIDDPAAVPGPDDALLPESECVDWVAVEMALDGVKIRLRPSETAAAVRLGVERGDNLPAVSKRLGINYDGAKTLLAGGLTPGLDKQVRISAALTEDGTRSDRQIAAVLGVHFSTVAKARERLTRQQYQLAS